MAVLSAPVSAGSGLNAPAASRGTATLARTNGPRQPSPEKQPRTLSTGGRRYGSQARRSAGGCRTSAPFGGSPASRAVRTASSGESACVAARR